MNEHVIAINNGGNDYSTSSGILYKADVYSVGGDPATSGYFFSNTTDHDIYRSLRYGSDFSYRIPVVNNNSYKVTLNFTNWSEGAGVHRGNVFAEGVQVLTNLDAFVGSGNQNLRAYDVTLNPFNVTGGFIDLRFVNTGAGNFQVNGISVVAKPDGSYNRAIH